MMTNNEILVKWLFARVVLLCVIAMLLAIDRCKTSGKKEIKTTDTVTRIILDTKWYPLAAERKPKAADSVFVPVPAKVDTQAILKCYFAKYAYRDTLVDSNIVVAIADTVSQNSILSRNYSYQIKRPQTLQQITNTLKQPDKVGFYFGASASLNKNLLAGFSPEVMITSKNKAAYGIGYDLLNKSLCGRIYWKINIRHE